MFESNTESHKINGVELWAVSDAQLDELISQYGLHTTVPFLRKASEWLAAESIAADEEILHFLDAIFIASVSKSKNIKIPELFSDDEEIVKTFADLFSKYKYLCGTKEKYISLEDMSHLASRYLHTLNVCPPSSVMPTNENKDVIFATTNKKELLALALDDTPSLPYGYESANKKTARQNSLIEKDDLFYLIDSSAISKKITDTQVHKKIIKVGIGGILSAVCDNCYGALICDSTGNEANLSDFVASKNDKSLIVITAECEASAISLFEANGIKAKKIAKATDRPAFTIVTATKTVRLKARFLRELFNTKTFFVPKISSETFAPPSYDEIYLISDGTKKKFDAPVQTFGHLISALNTSKCSFTNGINIALDSLFSLLSRGADRKKVGITVKISYTKENLSGAVAALLGIYRVAIELSLPEISSSIELSDSDSIFCSAYAKSTGTLTDKFADIEGSRVHLVSFGRFDNTTPCLMPDFSSVRKTCDALADMVSKNAVLSARAIDGYINSATADMCGKGIKFTALGDKIPKEAKAQGFILQLSKNTVDHSPIIGVIQKDNL